MPIVIGAIGTIALSIAMLVWMRETGFAPVPAEQRNTWQAMVATFRAGLAEFSVAPLLGIIFVISLIYGALTEGLDRLFTPYLLGRFEFSALGPLDDIVWWSVIALVSNLVGLAATILARRLVDTTSHAALTLGLGLFTAAIGVAVALTLSALLLVPSLYLYQKAAGLGAQKINSG